MLYSLENWAQINICDAVASTQKLWKNLRVNVEQWGKTCDLSITNYTKPEKVNCQ